jgi:hypothetical protein
MEQKKLMGFTYTQLHTFSTTVLAEIMLFQTLEQARVQAGATPVFQNNPEQLEDVMDILWRVVPSLAHKYMDEKYFRNLRNLLDSEERFDILADMYAVLPEFNKELGETIAQVLYEIMEAV